MTESNIAANLAQVRQNIQQARQKSSLATPEVLLLAVTKTQSVATIQEAAVAGLHQFGENRVQELLEKHPQLPGNEWHLIGHLQTNKVKYILGKVALIHSLDRIELAAEIEKRAARLELRVPLLVQVNIAEEDSKFGLHSGEVADFLEVLADYPHLHCQGLMTVGPFLDDAEELRPVFRELRQIFLREKARNLPHLDLRYLSMGMSNDYPVAVEEGANIIRVGSSLFGPRHYA